MAGKWQFLLHGEDADTNAALFFCRRFSGEDESRFRKIGFARQGLHLFGRQAPSVGNDSQSVAGQSAVGEYIDLYQRKFPR
jgi:hypothetical protein